MGLPGFAVVSLFLPMPDGRTEARAPDVPDGQKRDLVIERHEPFHDDPSRAGPSGGLGVVPGRLGLGFVAGHALPLAGRGHGDRRQKKARSRCLDARLGLPRPVPPPGTDG